MKAFILFVAICLGVVMGQSGQGIYTLQNSSCLYCPQGQYAAPKPFTGSVGGCGPGTGIIADIIPEYRFGDCCNAHDQCYGTCGMIKENCDRRFYACMLRTCDEDITNDNSRNRRCKAVASCYAGAVIKVDDVSCDAFRGDHDDSQCQCVENTNNTELPIAPEADDYAEIPTNPDCSIGALTGIDATSNASKMLSFVGFTIFAVCAVIVF